MAGAKTGRREISATRIQEKMIITPDFNILLFPKCGTHFIASAFEKTKVEIHLHTCTEVSIDVNHLPASKLPYGANQKPTGVVVRNVWDWYVSRYFYFEDCRIKGTAGFKFPTNKNFIARQWTENCGFGRTPSGFRKHLPYALEHFNLCDSYFQFIADAPKIYFMRHELLGEDLSKFIKAFSGSNFHAYIKTLAAISEQGRVNATEARPQTSDCYTRNLIEQVYQSELKYIARFGQEYKF